MEMVVGLMVFFAALSVRKKVMGLGGYAAITVGVAIAVTLWAGYQFVITEPVPPQIDGPVSTAGVE